MNKQIVKMLRRVAPLSLAVLFGSCCYVSKAQVPKLSDCTRAREQFTGLNDRLLLARNSGTESNPVAMKAGTQELEGYITRIMLARLSDSGDPSVIRSYLSCMQDREGERPWDRDTNTPIVFISQHSPSPTALSAMLIMRGGNAIPSTRPMVQCFTEVNRKWSLLGESGEELDGHTLFVSSLRSPISGEDWYLLSGNAIGDTGGRLYLEVVSCSASRYRRVWAREGFIWGNVEVTPDSVSVTYEKHVDPSEPLPAGQQSGPGSIIYDSGTSDPVRFSETLRVTKNGLEP